MSKSKVIPEFLPRKLGDAVIAARTKKDLSIRGAAAIAKVDFAAVYRMEIGDGIPKLDNFYRVCIWLDKPMDAFFIKPKKEAK